jgi:hypothetical protein
VFDKHVFSERAIGQDPPVRLEQLVETHSKEFLERLVPACSTIAQARAPSPWLPLRFSGPSGSCGRLTVCPVDRHILYLTIALLSVQVLGSRPPSRKAQCDRNGPHRFLKGSCHQPI